MDADRDLILYFRDLATMYDLLTFELTIFFEVVLIFRMEDDQYSDLAFFFVT